MIDEQLQLIWNFSTLQSGSQILSTPMSGQRNISSIERHRHHGGGRRHNGNVEDSGVLPFPPQQPPLPIDGHDSSDFRDYDELLSDTDDEEMSVSSPPKPKLTRPCSIFGGESYRSNNHNNNHRNHHHQNSLSVNQNSKQRRSLNFFNYIKKNVLNKGSFELNGRHKESFQSIDGMCYVNDLKFPNCVVENLCQKILYKGQPWFRAQNTSENGKDYFNSIQQKIHSELEDFYSFMKPLREEEIFRKAVFFSIADSIKKLPFVKQVKYYGSFSSKTYLPVSDIDIVVYCHQPMMISMGSYLCLYQLATNLACAGIIEKNFQIIPMSRIPLLKFHDSLTALPINITLDTPYVMERSEYIKERIPSNSYEMKILLFLKYYLLSKGTNQVFFGGIGSYALALMVIRYFQEESTQELIRNVNIYQDSILGYLLMGFLERYGDVEFFKHHMISVQNNGAYMECELEYDVRCPDKKISVLRIQDGVEPWNNVTCGSFNSSEVLKDFQVLHDKFMKGDKSKSKSLFGQVMYVVDSFIEYRLLVCRLFKEWFRDYDHKQYITGLYPIRAKFNEFTENRKVFQRNPEQVQITTMESNTNLVNCMINVYPHLGGRLALLFSTSNRDNDNSRHHRNNRRYKNRRGVANNNAVRIDEQLK